MLLHQVASFSYDSPLITVSLFFIMYITEFAYNDQKKFSLLSLILLCLAAFFIAPAKTLYFPIIALIFTVSSKSFKQKKNWILLPVFIIISAFLGIGLSRLLDKTLVFVNNPVTGFNFSLIPQQPTSVLVESFNNSETIKYLSKSSILWALSHPFRYLYILINSCRERLSYWVMTLGGRYLGWEAIPMNELLIYSILGLLLYQILRKTDGIATSFKNRLISICIFVVVSIAILTGQLLFAGFDPIAPVISGVQGRYFIPVVPLLFLFRKPQSIPHLSVHQGAQEQRIQYKCVRTFYI